MHIMFLETRRISEDGHLVRRCEQGKVYDLAQNAANHALNNGWARVATAEEIAASESDGQEAPLSVLDAMSGFRPQPTRGTAPQNPATLGNKVEE